MSKTTRPSVSSAVEEYTRKRSRYLDFSKRLKSILVDLLKEERIDYHKVEFRTKKVSSFADKVIEKGYTAPFKQMTDISGVRVIVHYLDEVPRIEDLIEREFKIDWKNTIDKSKIMKPNQFGYLSVQYVVSLPAQRLTTENQEFRGLKGEIQVRTLPQHVWAAISHQLQYKREEEIPYPLQRKLYRMAAQLELVDEQFQGLRDEVRLIKIYPETEVTAWTLPAFCRSSTKVKEIEADAEHAGISSGLDERTNADELAEACSKTGIKTLAELEKVLTGMTDRSRGFLQALAKKGRTREAQLQVGPMTLTLMLLYAGNPEKFTRHYLRTRGWARRAIENLLGAAEQSKFAPHKK